MSGTHTRRPIVVFDDDELDRLEHGFGPLKNHEADAVAVRAARECLRGARDVTSTHMLLVGLLERTHILHLVAMDAVNGALPQAGHQGLEFVEDRLRDLMMTKMCPDETGHSTVQLVQIAEGASLCGWARRFANTAARSFRRDLYRWLIRGGAVVGVPESDHDSDADVDERWVFAPSHGAMPADPQNLVGEPEPAAVDALAGACSRMSLLNPLSRTQRGARMLRDAYDLPEPTRPAHQQDRAVALAELAANPKAAWTVVGALSRGRIESSGLADLFADWDADALDRLRDRDPQVAHLLALAAVQGNPPLPNRTMNRVRSELVERCGQYPGGDSEHVRVLARMVADAWAASTATVVGSRDAGWTDKPDEQVAEEAARFARLATQLVRRVGGFDDVADVAAWLSGVAENQMRTGEQSEALTDLVEARHRVG